MILAETDAPFAAPEPYRGKRCDPLHVRLVAEKLAEIRAENPSDFRHALLKNTKTLFGV
jgi:TatD DNase family protein